MTKCLECQGTTNNPKFCGRSCAATWNNRNYPKRVKQLKGRCKNCGKPIQSTRKFCNKECHVEFKTKNAVGVAYGFTKRCNDCKEIKDISAFGVNRRNADGLMYQCKACNNRRVNEYNSKRGPIRRPSYKRHGLSQEQFNAMMNACNYSCEICGRHESVVSLFIDHDHRCCPSGSGSCGKCVRGILCHDCNISLGGFKDSVDSLQKAVLYLSNSEHGYARG